MNNIGDELSRLLKGCYGSTLKNSEVRQWLLNNLQDNMNRETERITFSIWGAPGCSKTTLVKSLQNQKVTYQGRKYDGFQVVDIPLAQIEEMGDVLGLPAEMMMMTKNGQTKWILTQNAVIQYHLNTGWTMADDVAPITVNTPPAWVPKEERPGIILFDDGNRASQRILKGLMQLVQDYKTISWAIPKGWSIVFTGNPDNRFNQVTAMDTAQLSRMKHVTLVPDATEWATWAISNSLDNRLIAFVLRYPEMMVGTQRTNPRTLAEFARALRRFTPLTAKNAEQVRNEANASLDPETVETLMIFLQKEIDWLIEPKDILENYQQKVKGEIDHLMNQAEPRIDIVSLISNRLFAYLLSSKYKFAERHVPNLQAWILNRHLPKDIAYTFIRRLGYSDFPHKKVFLSGNDEILRIIRMLTDKSF